MSLYFRRVLPFTAVPASLSDLLGLRLSLPLQGQGKAAIAGKKVAGGSLSQFGSGGDLGQKKVPKTFFPSSRPAQISEGTRDSTDQHSLCREYSAMACYSSTSRLVVSPQTAGDPP